MQLLTLWTLQLLLSQCLQESQTCPVMLGQVVAETFWGP
jgi:hypothetical protein